VKKLSLRSIFWLIVSIIVLISPVYWLKFRPVPVATHGVANRNGHGGVMGTSTLEARIKTTINPYSRASDRSVGGARQPARSPRMELFAKVAHERNAGVIVITHDSRALNVLDRLVEMEDGHLLALRK
jgi:hypothetical protein